MDPIHSEALGRIWGGWGEESWRTLVARKCADIQWLAPDDLKTFTWVLHATRVVHETKQALLTLGQFTANQSCFCS